MAAGTCALVRLNDVGPGGVVINMIVADPAVDKVVDHVVVAVPLVETALQVPDLDKDGNIQKFLTEKGQPVPLLDANGKPCFDDNGAPLYQPKMKTIKQMVPLHVDIGWTFDNTGLHPPVE